MVDGLAVHRVGGRYTFNLFAPPYFRRMWPGGHFDVIVEDLNKVPVFMPLFSRTPVVLLVHHLFGTTAFREASFPLATATWLLEKPIPWVFRGCTLVTVSPSTSEDLRNRGVDWEVPTIVPNGLNLSRFDLSSDTEEASDPALLYVGRLKRYKEIDLVLRALALLKESGSCPMFLIAGKGDDQQRLEKLVGTLGVGEFVRFLGYVEEEEKMSLLKKSWIHVLTSPKEGWGISVMEAAASGTPTIASDSPGLRDSVIHGKTGLLVPHGDVEALAEALRNLLTQHQRRAAMGRAAREFASAYSWDRSAREMLTVLENRVAVGLPQT